jgi:hypothetical protein
MKSAVPSATVAEDNGQASEQVIGCDKVSLVIMYLEGVREHH